MSLDKFERSAFPHTTASHRLQTQYGFIYDKDGNIDFGNIKLCNIQSPTENAEA